MSLRPPSLLSAALAVALACAAGATVQRPDWRDAAAALRSLQASDDPAAREFLRSVDQRSRALSGERRAARQAGIPRDPGELAAADVPRDDDARPFYEGLADRLAESPVDEEVLLLAGILSQEGNRAAEGRRRVRELFAVRLDLWSHIELATDRPAFSAVPAEQFTAQATLLPDAATLRVAARLIRARAYLHARDGEFSEAVRVQERGFRVAEHAAQRPDFTGAVAAFTCANLTLEGFADLLALAGEEGALAGDVRAALARHEPRVPLRAALNGEAVQAALLMEEIRARLREQGQPALDGLVRAFELPGVLDLPPPPEERDPLGSRERRWLLTLVDATEAEMLRELRERAAAAERPFGERRAAFTPPGETPDQRFNPFWNAHLTRLESYERLHVMETLLRARREVLLAAAAVMEHHARAGTFPAQLSEALPQVPADPFTGEPLQYRAEDGGFVVYSAGESGAFDGRDPGPSRRVWEALFRYRAG